VRASDPGEISPCEFGHPPPNLEIVLDDGPQGCVARIRGDLLGETCGGLSSVESILVNEAAIALDLSGIRVIDRAGLESLLLLMNAVQTSGRALSLGNRAVQAWPTRTRAPTGCHSETPNPSRQFFIEETSA
jgi:anti-anti-sigma regulatory factor